MGEAIDLKEYLQIFKRRGWILILLTLVAVVISGILNFFVMTPVYQSELTFMVNFSLNENAQITKDDMEYGQNLVEKYKPIIQSRKVTSKIKNNLGLSMSQGEIGNAIQISSISGPVMKVSVQSTNPLIARDIANEVPEVFGSELKRIAKVDGIEVIDNAVKPISPISPNKPKNIMMAAIIAIVISIFIIFLLEYLDNKVKRPQDIEDVLGIPVLGVVPEFTLETKIHKFNNKNRR